MASTGLKPAAVLAKLPFADSTGRYFLAYSGGLDSTVLLHLLIQALPADALQAIHINHGMHPDSDQWAQHCKAACAALAVPLQVVKVEVDQGAAGPEAAAREARYKALQGFIRAGDALVTAQHRDDQAETLLLQLLRGAGVAGLAGMPRIADFGAGKLARPLLDWERNEIQVWAEAHDLNWIEDPANTDDRFDRSFLRRRILPGLRERWPALSETLSRSAAHCGEAADLLAEIGLADSAACSEPGHALSINRLMVLSIARRRNAIRCWIENLGLPPPTSQHLDEAERRLLQAREDAEPIVSWPGTELRRYRDLLFAGPPLPPPPQDYLMPWPVADAIELPPGCGRLQAEPVESGGLRRQSGYEVGLVSEGQSIRLPGRGHSSQLKKLFQDAGVPPWVRRRMPVILHTGRLAAVGELWIDAQFLAADDESGWRLTWREPPWGYGEGI